MLNSLNGWPHSFFQFFWGMQDTLHEDLWVDEDWVVLEILGVIPLILGAIIFQGFIHIKFQLQRFWHEFMLHHGNCMQLAHGDGNTSETNS